MEMPIEDQMLYKFSCSGMGLSCPFTITGKTLEEVTQKALEHVREKHADDFSPVQSQAQIEQMEQALARSTRVVPG